MLFWQPCTVTLRVLVDENHPIQLLIYRAIQLYWTTEVDLPNPNLFCRQVPIYSVISGNIRNVRFGGVKRIRTSESLFPTAASLARRCIYQFCHHSKKTQASCMYSIKSFVICNIMKKQILVAFRCLASFLAPKISCILLAS